MHFVTKVLTRERAFAYDLGTGAMRGPSSAANGLIF
jgi:hypothetical protein